MENLNLKNLIEKNKKLGLIKSYEDFCKTPEAEEYALDEEDVKYYNITDDNIEQVLETIGEEVKGLSKDEFNDEENSYYENLYKKSVGLKI